MPPGVVVRDGPWKKLLTRAHKLDRYHVRVGVLASEGGDQTEDDSGITIVELAAIHEFGSPAAGLPERSFIRRTFTEAPWLEELTAKLAAAVVTDRLDPERALGLLGTRAAAEVKRTITDKKVRPLSKKAGASIARGEVKNPTTLVDTGRLLGAITYAVEEGSGEGEGI